MRSAALTCLSRCVLSNTFRFVFQKLKNAYNVSKELLFENLSSYFIFKIQKIRESSFVILIPLPILVNPYFASKSREHDVTLTIFSASC